ncbi:hypothetical protein ThrDRAFT_02427 [Frankia casuarinae]|nr:hypothetical protein CcI6DRAFT_03012 [Frankia sp. CcI6]EYT91908.1 hypothetical protein ThrDRAFT_02427 [Frankia casuarinae]KDA42665.1 hypothetical protein BMG523Draft_02505 [Frankia sp. BMG5.23]KEZ35542.1 hypothetical protein CEDDRAFT_03092 [Frankia sp. CeD]KFB04558.1 hypothetical protein ALLO2DRAFT_02676 [Frankia sp. Allo2]OHV54361.1 hypothetical protein CgIS1_12485 [Frankia sp. CgIS1]
MMTYSRYQTPFSGPFNAVISRDQTCDGPVADSSGRTRGGWVACARRSLVCPAARTIRYSESALSETCRKRERVLFP